MPNAEDEEEVKSEIDFSSVMFSVGGDQDNSALPSGPCVYALSLTDNRPDDCLLGVLFIDTPVVGREGIGGRPNVLVVR